MIPIKYRTPKQHYYIILNDQMVGETWAVSPEKARSNFWWKNVKYENELNPRIYSPEDFDVIEVK